MMLNEVNIIKYLKTLILVSEENKEDKTGDKPMMILMIQIYKEFKMLD